MYRHRVSIRAILISVLLAGCVNRAKEIVTPEPEGGGTLSCRQIVETCDASCSDPLCLHQCSPQGTPDGRAQHDAMLDCGQRNNCTDEACMRTNCSAELEACMGPDVAAPAPSSEPPPAAAPGAAQPAPSGGAP